MVQQKDKEAETGCRTTDLRKPDYSARVQKYHFKLYVTGMAPKSLRSIENLAKICKEFLKGNYELEVIDIYQQPELAREEKIIAVPTLIRKLPLPLKRFIGDLTETEKILLSLDLKRGKAENERPH